MADSLLISPGRETHVSITATQTLTTQSLRDTLDPGKRQCYFKDEIWLSLFDTYTVSNCWMECLMNLSRNYMPEEERCFPWNFPIPDIVEFRPCKPRERYEFLEHFRKIEMSKIVGSEVCLPNCGGTTYTITSSSAPFRRCDQANMGLSLLCHLGSSIRPQKWGELARAAYRARSSNGTIPDYIENLVGTPNRKYVDDRVFRDTLTREYDAYNDDIAVVTFYFPSHVAKELSRAPTMSMLDFVSQVGGLLGLCLGFSLISGVEIIYWFTIGYLEKKMEKPKPRKVSVQSSQF